jgi:superoxide reductase
MARRLEICKCYVCGNVVEVVHGGDGTLWCCGRPMSVFSERTVDHEDEEYFPVWKRTEDGVKVTVGGVHHPMDSDHHIQWIEIIADGLVYRKYLKPGDVPEAVFRVEAEGIRARAYCTQHGLYIER